MRKKIKSVLIVHCGALFLFSSATFAQDSLKQQTNKESFWDRVYFGGNFGLQFGTYTVVDLSPLMGYKITERLSAGVGATYIYFKYKDPYYPDNIYTTDIYGGSLFSRFFFVENIFAHVEFEVLNLEVPVFKNYQWEYGRKSVASILVGGGLRQPIGDNSGLTLMMLYNLNETSYSPYQNPIVRVGFGFGF